MAINTRKSFRDSATPVQGKLELIFMQGAKPTIVGDELLIDPTKTRIISQYKEKNLVVDEGRLVLNQTMAGRIDADPIFYFCTGTGGYVGDPDVNVDPNPPLGTDIDLYTPLFQKAITSREYPNSLATTFVTIVDELESNGSLTEFALKTRSGRLFARRTTRPMVKDENVFFVCKWTVQF